ncbi:MAG: SDR family NAD(P)-dependent oxidoreductase [Myxococcaceae bacterium]|nr:SDR family NAD(P)-dependent oxidoreductase [Myxococcaceae bacterium]
MGRRLEGKVAIVTGASSGVGWQSALRLAEAGVKVCVTARRQEALEMLVTTIRGRGGEAIAVACDVTDMAQVQQVVAECVRAFGRIDLLVNDAGVQSYGYFEDLPFEQIVRIFDVNAFGPMRMARAVLPHLRAQGSGHIINVASMLSKGAAPLLSAYTASKHAMYGWAETLRLELYTTGIDVSSVLVPSVATGMFDHAPTLLGLAPQPVPPTYDPDVAARAVVKAARTGKSTLVPVLLQGRLLLWAQALARPVADAIMGRFGARMQMGNEPVSRREGNLFQPVPQGIGAHGTGRVKPTPPWKRGLLSVALAGLVGGAAAAVGAGGYGVARWALR